MYGAREMCFCTSFEVVVWKFSICLHWLLKARLLIGLRQQRKYYSAKIKKKRRRRNGKNILPSAYLCNNRMVQDKNHSHKCTISGWKSAEQSTHTNTHKTSRERDRETRIWKTNKCKLPSSWKYRMQACHFSLCCALCFSIC